MSTIALGHGYAGHRRPAQRPVRRPVRPQPAPVRLTRRGRVVVTLGFLVAILAVLVAFGSVSAATDDPGTPLRTRTVVVHTGDTLWEIAADIAGPGETRAMVQRIEELNALPGAGLQAGQRLAVPALP
jgi:hypothetical protein